MSDYEKNAVRSAISTERLARYVNKCGGCDDSALDLYGLNMALCEAFYTPLQAVEICLRNGLHDAMKNCYGTNWMTNGGPPLEDDALEAINAIVDDRARSNRPTNAPDIVAAISFSFWVGLLATRYDSNLWRKNLHKAFANMPKPAKRSACHSRFNAIRRFRNRVAHHEPIFDRDLLKMHNEILEAISWLSPDKSKWAAEKSRVPAVLEEFRQFQAALLPNDDAANDGTGVAV